MMAVAEWDRELVAHLAGESTILRKTQMISVAWLTPTNKAGLLRDKSHMIAIANTPQFRMHQNGFIDRGR